MTTDNGQRGGPQIAAGTRAARRRTWGHRVAVFSLKFFFIATVVLLGGEAVTRVYLWSRGWTANCYAAQLQLFRPHRVAGYDLRPNFLLKSGVFRISVNSLGLRGPQLPPKPGPDVKRIALIGGSSAFGYLVSDGEEAARLLETELNAAGCQVQVLNAGVPGYNLYQTLIRYDEMVAPLKPDIVIAYLGWNDLRYVTSDAPLMFSHLEPPPVWERLASHSALYGLVVYRLAGGRVRLAPADLNAAGPTDLGTLEFRSNLERLAGRVRVSGARLVICAQASAAHQDVDAALRPHLAGDEATRRATVRLGQWLHQSLKDFAESHALTFVDAYSSIEPTAAMLGDYIHLTPAGERRLALLLREAILPMECPPLPDQ